MTNYEETKMREQMKKDMTDWLIESTLKYAVIKVGLCYVLYKLNKKISA